ncbi:HNH endonuclease [Longibacter salinarum]|uniref:HNH endonuclease n=1 Tax=Longibacter salinarum TaxID=1850348 RepID=A0A2A8CZY7_9BACT|nr:HNH endonuclease [Longibacter salinarum]PEN14289.1 HNH endonuclease [Longibacter salinarum]
MERDTIRSRFEELTVWSRGDQRAPHKPLLVLYALAELERGNRWVGFLDVDEHVTALLKEFGPPRKSHHAEYPFWRLQNDGVWTVLDAENLTRRASNTDPLKSELKEHNTRAGFLPDVWSALEDDAALRHEIARMLLDEHFADSLHEDILDAVGLDLTYRSTKRPSRDPAFRQDVLRAYRYRCAVCGFDLKLDARPIGLEAAHIKWRQARGPDQVSNGICLCALHHKMLDKGAIHFTVDLKLMLSESLHGSNPHFRELQDQEGQRIHVPQRDAYYPDENFVQWHVKEVFRGEYAAG